MKVSNQVREFMQLEQNCVSKSKKAKRYKIASIIELILGVVCAIIGIWEKDNFWTPFWLSFGGGLWGLSFIEEMVSLFLSQLCDMQKLQLLSFKIEHNIKTSSTSTPKVQETTKLDDNGATVGGIKLENYDD